MLFLNLQSSLAIGFFNIFHDVYDFYLSKPKFYPAHQLYLMMTRPSFHAFIIIAVVLQKFSHCIPQFLIAFFVICLSHFGFLCGLPIESVLRRFGQKYVDRVANPKDIVYFQRRRVVNADRQSSSKAGLYHS